MLSVTPLQNLISSYIEPPTLTIYFRSVRDFVQLREDKSHSRSGENLMTTPDMINTASPPPPGTPWYKSKKMWIAVPLSLVLIGMNLVIYQPAAAIAGMLTDSCSGDSNAYIMWDIWLWYLWPVVMVVSSLFPAFLILKHKTWWKVVLGVIASEAVIIIWYLLWLPILRITGC
jgi:hypothetical protein